MLEASCHCGAAGWTLAGDPGSVTACNCTLCHRYGALWAYDQDGSHVALFGATSSYRRAGKADPALEYLFCPTCANVLAARSLRLARPDNWRIAVNIRLAPLEKVADLPIDHFDGRDSFEDLPSDGRTVRDLWA